MGFEVIVGGGLGRTPMIGKTHPRVPAAATSSWPISRRSLRVYNRYGRRDNLYKARIKILVHELGPDRIRQAGRGGVQPHLKDGALKLPAETIERIARQFAPPLLPQRPAVVVAVEALKRRGPRLRSLAASPTWRLTSVPGYAIVTVSLKPAGAPPATPPPTRWKAWPTSPSLQPRRDPRQPRAEPGPAPRCGRRPADVWRALGDGWASPKPTSD